MPRIDCDTVREKLAGAEAQETQGLGGVGGKGTPLGGDAGGAGAADEGEGEVAQGGHHLGRVTRAQTGAILPEGDVADAVTALDSLIANGKTAGADRRARWA